MKKILGILAYLLLIVSAVFIDTPIFALLAMPLFLSGIILMIVFNLSYLRMINKYRRFYTFTSILGTLILCGLLGYAAVEYNQYQVDIDRNIIEERILINWINVIIVIGVNLFATLLIFLGIKHSDQFNLADSLLVLILSILFIPITLFLIKIAVLTGIWLGG